MQASTRTILQRANRQDVTYVRAAPRWRPLQLSLLLDKGMAFSPKSLNLIASDPPPFQKPIQQKTKQMQWSVVVSSKDDCRAETTLTLSKLGTGSYGGRHRVREFLQKPTGVSLELSLQIRLAVLLRAANTGVSDKNSPSTIGGNFDWFASTYCSHCSTRGNEDPCLIFWRKQ